jgi:hypothetical protein
MLKRVLFFILILFSQFTRASNIMSLAFPEKNNSIPPAQIFKKNITAREFSKISIQEFEKISGKHLNIWDRLKFKILQKRLKNSSIQDGAMTLNSNSTFLPDRSAKNEFHLGGLLLGLFLGPIGVLVAYLIHDEKQKIRKKWAWLGFAALIIVGIFSLVLI